ncbi:MAG: site-specific DNA-methyltransferase, partial [Deltaproteobacteria bacterium]|nr:site-specific DNA-methyltransferase [Deltaproteobacteria bacterium]
MSKNKDTQVAEAQTPTRSPNGKPALNDLDLTRWREYDDLITESLWQIPERDRSGAHNGDYHGNFVPQIPYQALRRYTKRGDVVLDPFLGSGTTLIECRRLGRHGLGIELKPELVQTTRQRINHEKNPDRIKTQIINADSADIVHTPRLIEKKLQTINCSQTQLAILHP